MGKNDIFGANFMVHAQTGKSSCNVRALTYCEFHIINRDDIFQILDMYPEFALDFSRNLKITFDQEYSFQSIAGWLIFSN